MSLDTSAARRALGLLRPEIAALRLHPERVRDVSLRLSQLGLQVTAACEAAFLVAMEPTAA